MSLLLLNIIMDKIIKGVRASTGYRMGTKRSVFSVMRMTQCYLQKAKMTVKGYYVFSIQQQNSTMMISSEKTKCMTISKEPIRCKLEVNNQIITRDDI